MSARLLLFVFLGGGAGSVARFAFSYAMGRAFPGPYAWGTFGVNVIGSFLIALLLFAVPQVGNETPELRVALGTGVLGGFTTYSAFNLELVTLANAGQTARAAFYAALTLVACLAAGGLGWWVGRRMTA